MVNVTPTSALLAQLAALAASSEPLNALKLGLFTNNTVLSKATVLADLTELTNVQFPGYAQIAFTWGAVYQDLQGNARLAGSRCEYVPSGPPPDPGITIYGAFAVDAATGLVLAFAYLFDTPQVVTLQTQAVVQYPNYQLGS